MRFLQWLGHDIAQREIEIGPVIFAAGILKHRDDRAHRVFPDGALFFKRATKRFEFGAARTLAHAKFDAALTDEIKGGDALGNPRRWACRQLHDAVRQADLLGALACRPEKHLGGRRVRIFLEEMVFDLPGEIVAEPVG